MRPLLESKMKTATLSRVKMKHKVSTDYTWLPLSAMMALKAGDSSNFRRTNLAIMELISCSSRQRVQKILKRSSNMKNLVFKSKPKLSNFGQNEWSPTIRWEERIKWQYRCHLAINSRKEMTETISIDVFDNRMY